MSQSLEKSPQIKIKISLNQQERRKYTRQERESVVTNDARCGSQTAQWIFRTARPQFAWVWTYLEVMLIQKENYAKYGSSLFGLVQVRRQKNEVHGILCLF